MALNQRLCSDLVIQPGKARDGDAEVVEFFYRSNAWQREKSGTQKSVWAGRDRSRTTILPLGEGRGLRDRDLQKKFKNGL